MTHKEFQRYRKLDGKRITNFTNSIMGIKSYIQNACKNNFSTPQTSLILQVASVVVVVVVWW